jgi:hypothetical protein
MPAFAEDGTVTCPFPAAWLEFYNADKDKWTAVAYRTEECGGGREFSHGTVVAALPDGSFPPVFLWDKINYRVVAKGADGSVLATIERVEPGSEFVAEGAAPEPEPVRPQPVAPDLTAELAAEVEALRAENAELRRAMAAVEEPPPLLPEPDALMADYGPVGEEADITGDMLLDAFEVDPTETAAVVRTLSATRLKHLSEQLNVERARLDREHQATGIANPRSASIDRLLGLLTRRGEV